MSTEINNMVRKYFICVNLIQTSKVSKSYEVLLGVFNLFFRKINQFSSVSGQ